MRTIVLIAIVMAFADALGGYGGGGVEQKAKSASVKAASVRVGGYGGGKAKSASVKAVSVRGKAKSASVKKAASIRVGGYGGGKAKSASAKKAKSASAKKVASAKKAKSASAKKAASIKAAKPAPAAAAPAGPAPVTPQVKKIAAQAVAEVVDDHTFHLVPVRINYSGCDADVSSLKAEVTALAANVYKLINKARLCTGNAPIPEVTFQEPPAAARVPPAEAAPAAAPQQPAPAAPQEPAPAAPQQRALAAPQEPAPAAPQEPAPAAPQPAPAAPQPAPAAPQPAPAAPQPAPAAPQPAPAPQQPADRYKKSKQTGFLTDASGRTCYTNGASSVTCTGACADFWPPCIASAKDAALAGSIGTVSGNGKKYGTYNGKALYLFANDNGPDDKQGDGSNGFSAVRP